MTPTLPIYCLHGLMGTGLAHCGRQIDAWRAARPVVLIDLPGHGRSPHDATRPYIAHAVNRLGATMRHHGRGHLVGTSYLGGAIAVRTALAHPDLVADLVLAGFVADIECDVFSGWIDGFVRLGDTDRALAEHYDAIHGPRWRSTLGVVAQECREAYASSFAVSGEMLAGLCVPTLVLNGDRRSEEREAAANLPRLGALITGATIPGAGHIAGHEKPAAFNLMVERFWEFNHVPTDPPPTHARSEDGRGAPGYRS